MALTLLLLTSCALRKSEPTHPLSREGWEWQTVLRLREFRPSRWTRKARVEKGEKYGDPQVEYGTQSQGLIKFADGGWLYVITCSSHAEDSMGDVSLAIDRSVTIRQREMDRFDEYFSKLVSSAEMEVNVGFESSAVYDIREQTRLKALRIARHKAEGMANELGAKLGKVLTIDEHRQSAFPFNPMSNASFFDPGNRPEVDTSGGTFAPGAIEVRVTVYVTFAIE